MSDQAETASTPNPAEPPAAAPANASVARCCNAWTRARQEILAAGGSRILALIEARRAYSEAMPPLAGSQNIRDFVACVAHGMLKNVFPETSATKLLYAAQVAYNTLPKASSRTKRQAA